MRGLLSRPGLTIRCQVILGALLIYAGATKIADPAEFACAISRYELPLLTPAMLRAFAVVLPWVEALTGLALVFGILARSGGVIGAALLVMFIGVEVWAIARGLDIDCGCFSQASATKVGWGTVLRNVGMLLLALQVAAFARNSPQREQSPPAHPREADDRGSSSE